MNPEDRASARRPRGFRIPTEFLPLVTALVSVAGVLLGVVQYSAEQKKNRQERTEQSKREAEVAEREFMKPWLESQRGIYLEALNAAAAAATPHDDRDRVAAEQAFWRLYHGRMILVETTRVSGAMVTFGECLKRGGSCDAAERNRYAKALASAMAESMASTARQSYREFAANQFRY